MKTKLLLLLLSLSATVWAQSGSVRGVVRNPDQTPATGVNVTLLNTSKGAVSDEEGRFEINGISPGTYIVSFSFVGLRTLEIPIDIAENARLVLPDVVMQEGAQELSQIVVSGDRERYTADKPSQTLRLNGPLIEIPQNIQIVTAELLQDQQVISMSDGLVRNVSGVTRVEHWGDLYANIVTRGSQLQAFRNGFNVVNSFWGPLTEDMSFVDHVEFVKGPAGFMLANGDPSGLYNVVTKKPTGNTKGDISISLGSFDFFRSALDLDGKLSKDGKLLYRLNLSAQNRKSHRPNEYNDRYVIAPVVSYQLDKNTKLTAEYTYQRANMSDVGSFYVFSTEGFAVLPRKFTALPAGMPGTRIDDHSMFLVLEHQLSDRWKVTGQLARFDYFQEGSSMWPSAVNPDGTMIRGASSWEAKSAMTMGQVFINGEFQTSAIRHRVLAGLDVANKEYFADWGQNHVLDSVGAEFDTRNPYYGVPVNGYPKFDYTTPLEERAYAIGGLLDQRYTGLYLQDELGFMDNRIRVTLAGRYTSVSQSEWGGEANAESRITPRIAASVSLNKSTSVYALYDQAFIPQGGQLSNGQSVRPITGSNREIGIKRDWFNGKWNTTVAVYTIVKQHELIADPEAAPNAGLSVELGEKVAKGVEFDLRGSILPGLNLIANYAYTDSRITDLNVPSTSDMAEGDPVPGFATHTANSWISYKIGQGIFKGTGFSLGFTYLADRHTYWDKSPDPDKVLPNYFKLDGGLFWQNDRFKVTANVFNVLDDYLYTGSYYKWLSAYYWQADPPRNVRLSINYSF